jgi:FlaA1/EpsC-like NDP-sugar epimerase
MLDVNIFLTRRLLDFAVESGSKKFFCVSTDKAANPVNLMGASKRIMEMFLLEQGGQTEVSTARFANVLFSDGSLPHAWMQRMEKGQPISAPRDVKRYFITAREAAILCLFSVIFGKHGEIFFPKLFAEKHLVDFPTIARNYLAGMGYFPVECETEEHARALAREGRGIREWPCYFFDSDTTGEKEFEEFFTAAEPVFWRHYVGMGITHIVTQAKIDLREQFVARLNSIRERNRWSKADLLNCVEILLPTFAHLERGRHLDNRM